jgi:hypothetical protein
MNELRSINWMHAQITKGVISETDLLMKKGIDEYGAILDTYRYDIHLKHQSTQAK